VDAVSERVGVPPVQVEQLVGRLGVRDGEREVAAGARGQAAIAQWEAVARRKGAVA
tara:strand:+ start:398 stop:565 length:168 start_codon:yes stop_codon:yes gene_type:complete